jgi:predicted permease
VVARLRPDASIEQARAELDAVAGRLARVYPAFNAGWTVTVEPLRDTIIGDFGRATWLLLAAVAVVLLVSCVNVAGLLLVRAAARERETSVREALGAGRSRLVRLWLTEAALLAALGSGLGLTLAWLGVLALKAAAPPGIPRLDAIAIDRPVLLTTLLASVLATLIIGAAPLYGRVVLPITRRLQGSGATSDTAGRRVVRDMLVLAQCAGAVVLVVLAVMLTRSFARLSSFDLGWTPTGVVSMKPEPRSAPRTRARSYWLAGWADRLIAQLEATPGIERAAITTSVPLSPWLFPVLIARDAASAPGNDPRWSAVVHHVTDGYFDLMGLSLVAGRTFGPSDRFSEALITSGRLSEGRPVAVISQSVARALWPGQPAIGRSVRIVIGSVAPPIEVVGVVEDLQFHAVGEDPALHVFVPWTQQNTGNPYLLARVSGDAASALAVVRRVTQAVEPGTGVDRMVTAESLVQQATAQPRFTTSTVAGFGMLALVLAGVGVYGTLSFVVGARTREIAVRLSLGASRSVILPGVLRLGLAPVVAGGLLGLGIAAALTRTFEALLFQIEPFDLPSFSAGAALLLVAAMVAAMGPAYRATHVDPATTLRAE